MQRLLPIVLAAAALAVVAALLSIDLGTDGHDGAFPVRIEGPADTLYDGTVEVRAATAYTALLAAAADGGWEVEATGHGEQTFVVRIGPHANGDLGAASGWCYAVWEEGWSTPGRSAAIVGLRDGQRVLWSFERHGCSDVDVS